MRTIRRHLSYANVIATLALFVALGGSTYAALHLKKNSVGAKQLKKHSVTNVKLADGAVNSAKIADGSVGTSDISASLHLQCRSGTSYLQGACIQNNPAGTAPWGNAEQDCQTKGGRLPNVSELMSLAARGVAFGAQEWTDVISFDGTVVRAAKVFDGGKFVLIDAATNPGQYRCVFDPTG
jgi:hypothetical protein